MQVEEHSVRVSYPSDSLTAETTLSASQSTEDGAQTRPQPEPRRDDSTSPPCRDCKPAPARCRCPRLSPEKLPERNLVVCIDGTAQQIDVYNTHVVQLYSMLVNNKDQLTHYINGVGSYVAGANLFTRMRQKVVYGTDIAFALAHEKNILGSYRWLCENYTTGSRIFIFGFSRGAYQARVVSELIACVGLLRPTNVNQIPYVFRQYLRLKQAILKFNLKDPESKHNDPGLGRVQEICEHYKTWLSHRGARVHFLGAWDTVTSIGLTQGPRYVMKSMLHVCACRHALGLHEKRVKYLPEYFQSGIGSLASAGGNVKEVWFAGCHSDVGGGNLTTGDPDAGGPALRWMLYEAMEYGVLVQPFQTNWGEVTHKPSMNFLWRMLEFYPFQRLSYNSRDYNAITRRPHLSSGRRIREGQLIHVSVRDCIRSSPQRDMTNALKNVVVVNDTDEGSPRTTPILTHLKYIESQEDKWEVDSHSVEVNKALWALRDAVEQEQLPTSQIADSAVVETLLRCPVGRQSLIDSLHNQKDTDTLLKAVQVLTARARQFAESLDGYSIRKEMAKALIKVLAEFHSRPRLANPLPLPRHPKSHLRSMIAMFNTRSRLPESDSPPKDIPTRPATQLWEQVLAFADQDDCDTVTRIFCSDKLSGRSDTFRAVAWSRKHIASASKDSSIELWGSTKDRGRSISGPLFGHEDSISSIAFSSQGTFIVSGSDDGTIRVWNVQTLQPTQSRSPIKHKGRVRSALFSPDGARIAYGVDGEPGIHFLTVDSDTGVAEPRLMCLFEDEDSVLSVAFSPKGTYIASGCADGIVRVWSTKARFELWMTTQAESEGAARAASAISSVVFSPNERWIIAGSEDNIVRIWDVENKELVQEPLALHGHCSSVTAVAISPCSDDGKYLLASASADSTVRLWRVWEDRLVSEFVGRLKSHDEKKVNSLAFSQDGKRIVTGSDDGVLRIWEVEGEPEDSKSKNSSSKAS